MINLLGKCMGNKLTHPGYSYYLVVQSNKLGKARNLYSSYLSCFLIIHDLVES
jgi:hypothetical protein